MIAPHDETTQVSAAHDAITLVSPASGGARPPSIEMRVLAALRCLGTSTRHGYPLESYGGTRVAYPHASWVDHTGRRQHVYGRPTASLDSAAAELLWLLQDAVGVRPVPGVVTFEPMSSCARADKAVMAGRWTGTREIVWRARDQRWETLRGGDR